MKIYTKTGDRGETGLFGGVRVRKNDPKVEAYGTVDELNACLGLARAHGLSAELDRLLVQLQNDLFVLGAELATADGYAGRLPVQPLDESHVRALEVAIDEQEAKLTPLSHFILPAGVASSAHFHLARTVCRRAERRLLDLPSVRLENVIYLNRLSDLLFVLARVANAESETPETPWSAR